MAEIQDTPNCDTPRRCSGQSYPTRNQHPKVKQKTPQNLKHTFQNGTRVGGRSIPTPRDDQPNLMAIRWELSTMIWISTTIIWCNSAIGTHGVLGTSPHIDIAEQGITTCTERHGPDLALTLRQILHGEIYHGRKKPESPALFADHDVMGPFDPSRFPPRAASQSPHARLEI